MSEHENLAPIFVIGCQRSGTTLMRLILDTHSHISCGPETRFLQDLERITGDEWHRMSQFGFPREYWDERVAEFFDRVHRDYAERRGKRRWADKTPRYAMQLEYVDRLFPTCQFIHMIRDGRDVVASHRDRGNYWDGLTAVEKWRNYLSYARPIGARLPSGRYLEVRYENLVQQPEKTMREVIGFLGEPWEPEILGFDRVEHDIGERYQQQMESRRAPGESVIYKGQVGAWRKLDPLTKLVFKLRSGRMLRELGYA